MSQTLFKQPTSACFQNRFRKSSYRPATSSHFFFHAPFIISLTLLWAAKTTRDLSATRTEGKPRHLGPSNVSTVNDDTQRRRHNHQRRVGSPFVPAERTWRRAIHHPRRAAAPWLFLSGPHRASNIEQRAIRKGFSWLYPSQRLSFGMFRRRPPHTTKTTLPIQLPRPTRI